MIRMRWTHMEVAWPLTNKCPKNLGRTYLPVRSSVLSMETVVGELWMREHDRDPRRRV
jgi:hypothetical protein